MDLIDRLLLPDNLYWAWNRAKQSYRSGDSWFDDYAITKFEARLDEELRDIRRDFKRLKYRCGELRPLPQPKKANNHDEKPIRQSFCIPVRDQVAWIALVNVIGPIFDQQMPLWSYGNRLHRSVWYEDVADHPQLVRGPYRSTVSSLYRPFRQSWPLYRRHISVTVRKIAKLAEPPEDDIEAGILKMEESIPETDPNRLPYLIESYWQTGTKRVYRAQVDLKKFYPNINQAHLIQNLKRFGTEVPDELIRLAEDMLHFRVNVDGVPVDALEAMQLPITSNGSATLQGLPTGLFVSGFLANVAILDLDREVMDLVKGHQVAHFRYVDDHSFLAPSADHIESWLTKYHQLLAQSGLSVSIHPDKCEPAPVKKLILSLDEPDSQPRPTPQEWDELATVDPRYPAPLMTATLAKISMVARAPFALFDQRAQDALLDELRFLMAARLPDDEVRDDTRMAFAASRLASLGPKRISAVSGQGRSTDDEVLSKNRRLLQQLVLAIRGYPEKLRLWTRTLDFWFASGLTELDWLDKELKNRLIVEPHSSVFLTAYLKRHFVSLLFRGLRELLAQETAARRRTLVAKQLQVLKAFPFASGTSEWWFESSAERLWSIARVAMSGLCRARFEILAAKAGSSAVSLASEMTLDKWAKDFKRHHAPSDLGLWAFWLERQTSNHLSTNPGPLWSTLVPLCDFSDAFASTALTMYPSDLPANAIAWALSKGEADVRRNLAWVYQVFVGLQQRGLFNESHANLNEIIATAQRATSASSAHVTLVDWAEWTRNQAAQHPHDPRVSEWTALEIVNQVASRVGKPSEYQIIHPANVDLPRSWIERETPPWSWESWRREMQSVNALVRLRAKKVLRLKSPDAPTGSWAPLTMALGWLLLGLLRQSYRMPPAFYATSDGLGTGTLVRGLLRQLPISSRTIALLEACLLPRARENVWFELWNIADGQHADTQRDPPVITELDDFRNYVSRSQKTLVKHQLSVLGSMPRQMIPRRLDQSQIWHPDGEEE